MQLQMRHGDIHGDFLMPELHETSEVWTADIDGKAGKMEGTASAHSQTDDKTRSHRSRLQRNVRTYNSTYTADFEGSKLYRALNSNVNLPLFRMYRKVKIYNSHNRQQ